ncbi:MAG: ATP phosphoribosyltransferase regulatory subunit [Chloroflexi bacterium]|nr:ATP phosphoribosyltransferase regulatory subunit [Chloroflexota bacterium]
MKVPRCKGSRDLSPGEMVKFRLIEKAFRDCCLKWGYGEVRTPTLEYLHLFTSTGTLTPSLLSKVYSFLDWDGWSGERVVLRPDGTIPVARLYIDSMEKEGLAKLFYVTNIFIFDETGKKSRERWQCGVELIGAGSPLADAELISLALEILHKLGLKDTKLRLSHAGLVRAMLAKLGLSHDEQTKVFDQVIDGDIQALAGLKPRNPELAKALSLLLDLRGKSSGFLKNLKALFQHNLPELETPIDNFINVAELLQALGQDYRIDIASGRGFEYYTGVNYHLLCGEQNVGAGGRYDDLVPLMGGEGIPASGFALYLDPLMDMVKPETFAEPAATRVQVRVEPGDTETAKRGFVLASRLREAGYIAELELGAQKQADFNWSLEVKGKAPHFILTNKVGQRRFEAGTAEEVLALLRKNVNKDSVA